jgi:predicted DNA-binding protein (UPF0251 family)
MGRGPGRPCLRRNIQFDPKADYFKPRGIPMFGLEVVELSIEEAEALRLKNIKDLDQIECAKQMKTSATTFQRILTSAHKKVSDAIVNGKAIKIIKI